MFHSCLLELLQKDPEDLTMNQSENYRKTQEERYIIDRTIPFMDYGKGCKFIIDIAMEM